MYFANQFPAFSHYMCYDKYLINSWTVGSKATLIVNNDFFDFCLGSFQQDSKGLKDYKVCLQVGYPPVIGALLLFNFLVDRCYTSSLPFICHILCSSLCIVLQSASALWFSHSVPILSLAETVLFFSFLIDCTISSYEEIVKQRSELSLNSWQKYFL